MINLCLGLIATNEEPMLSRFLPDLSKAFKGDVVAIDYGSIDKTNEIFNKHSKVAIKRDWPNDFGKAKTELCKLAEDSGYDWLFLIDADETIDLTLVDKIKQCIEENPYDVYYMPRFSYVSPGVIDGSIGNYPDLQARLFKLNVGYHYRNIRHCILCKGDDTACAWELNYGAVIPVTIMHFKGYKGAEERLKADADRKSWLGDKTNAVLETTDRPLIW